MGTASSGISGKIILLLIGTISASVAHGSDTEKCLALSGIAKQVMSARQHGTPMSKILAIAKKINSMG